MPIVHCVNRLSVSQFRTVSSARLRLNWRCRRLTDKFAGDRLGMENLRTSQLSFAVLCCWYICVVEFRSQNLSSILSSSKYLPSTCVRWHLLLSSSINSFTISRCWTRGCTAISGKSFRLGVAGAANNVFSLSDGPRPRLIRRFCLVLHGDCTRIAISVGGGGDEIWWEYVGGANHLTSTAFKGEDCSR